jgi:hypothetical protein
MPTAERTMSSIGASGTRPATQSLAISRRSHFQIFSLYGTMKWRAKPLPMRQSIQSPKLGGHGTPARRWANASM